MKSNLSTHLLFFFVVVGITSCTKTTADGRTDMTTIEGTLLDASTRQPIPNGKILLMSSFFDEPQLFYTRGYGLRNALITDENGRFYYSFKHSEDTMYAMAAEADMYFGNINSGDGAEYPRGRATGRGQVNTGYQNKYNKITSGLDVSLKGKGVMIHPEMRLAPMGWITFKVENISPTHYNDVMKLGGEGSNGQPKIFSGADVNTIYLRGPISAGRFAYIGYNVTSNSQFTYYEDSIFLKAHDTTLYEIKY